MKKLLFIFSVIMFHAAGIHAENLPKDLIIPFLPQNPIIVDAGAYNGLDSCEMINVWPEATIFAFEPVPDIFKQLNVNTCTKKNIHCFQKALSDKVGHALMYVSGGGGDQSSSLLEPHEFLGYYFPHITFENKIIVETTTLDAWAEEMNIDHIDLLWFDLQGMEAKVLKSSPKMLSTVKAVYAEVSYTYLYKDALHCDEFRKWMEDQGFVALYQVTHHITFGDVLFVRKELAQKVFGASNN